MTATKSESLVGYERSLYVLKFIKYKILDISMSFMSFFSMQCYEIVKNDVVRRLAFERYDREIIVLPLPHGGL